MPSTKSTNPTTDRPGIGPREAAMNAHRFYQSVTGSERQASIEEIEFDGHRNAWIVTLGFLVGMAALVPVGGSGTKEYKRFEVDASSGEVNSMKIRVLES
jgi:hypothetical protein